MANNKYKFTFGADPEFFVMDKKDNILPACRLFGGDKGSPMFLSPDGGYLEDGTTVEFNVTPCSTLAEVRQKISNLILVFLNKHDQYKLSKSSSATFSPEVLAKFPEARNIGCAPDLSAYGLRIAPSIAGFGSTRFAGGHIHVGIDPWPEGLEKASLVKFLDLLFLCPGIPKFVDSSRWRFYGHPGLYRETKYGVEHRSPDNYWCNPSRFSVLPGESRDWLKEHISQFDRTFENLSYAMNFDGHGARVNVEMRQYIKAAGIEARMNDMGVYDSPRKLQPFAMYGGESEHWSRRWSQERLKVQGVRESMAETPVAATK